MKKLFLCFFGVVFYTAGVLAADSVATSRKTQNNSDNIEAVEKASPRSARRVSTGESKAHTTATRNSKNTAVSARSTANVVARQKSTGARTATTDNVVSVSRDTRQKSTKTNNVVARTAAAQSDTRTTKARASIFSKKTAAPTAESITAAKEVLERTADLNNTCQKQYNECMDQFCMVVDTNQKRCSCSANLARYEKVQKAVEDANAELNEVAQNIRYVGLSANEIRAIMSATEAEEAMSKTKDNTETRSMLEDIVDMIKDPTSSATNYSVDSSSIMDLDFSSDSDLFGLDLFNSSTDISNKRGRELYQEATKRCKSVLNACKDAGGTESQITGNYDLAIDKDCVAYEQGLEKLNETLVSNVRSANLMLQKARLAVLQNKNQYDAKGCIGALEECMLDDMVCGTDYVKCLDPTKQFIDENGNVVLGRNITNITAFLNDPDGDANKGYSNSKIDIDFIKSSENDTSCADHDGKCIVNYLLKKIGTGATVQDGGLCRAVLDKCQDYTYNKTAKSSVYNPYNEVIVNYIQRAMVNIKAAQARIISNYAQTCLSDISDCYNKQYTQINSWTTTASAENVYNVLTGACYNVALTCGYAVFAYDIEMGARMEELANSGDTAANIDKKQKLTLIEGVSNLFYQSLLCPDNSMYTSINKNSSEVPERYVNDRCICKDGYKLSDSACVVCEGEESCTNPSIYNSRFGLSSFSNSSSSSSESDSNVEHNCPNGQYMSGNTCLSCPAKSSLQSAPSNMSAIDLTQNGYVNAHCKCNAGLKVEDGECVDDCSGGYVLNLGCVSACPSGYYSYQYECVQSCPDTTYVSGQACVSCPANATIVSTSHTVDSDGILGGYVQEYCKCNNGYSTYQNTCVYGCPSHTVNNNGICECSANYYTPNNGTLCSVYCDGYYVGGMCHNIKNVAAECSGYKTFSGTVSYTDDQCIVDTSGKWTVKYVSGSYSGKAFCSDSATEKTGNNSGAYCFCTVDGESGWARTNREIADSSVCAQYCVSECASMFARQTKTSDVYSSFEEYLQQIYGE